MLSLVWWPTHGEGVGGVPTLIYPLDNCFETEIITTEYACIFKHCSFKTTLVSHVLIKALVEVKEKCMAGEEGGGGHSSPPEKQLLRTEKAKQFL